MPPLHRLPNGIWIDLTQVSAITGGYGAGSDWVGVTIAGMTRYYPEKQLGSPDDFAALVNEARAAKDD